MAKLLLLFLFLPTLCYGQTKSEDYWVYIKDRAEITSSDRIAGTSQKGDIVEVIPCSRLGRNEPSELEKKEYLIIKVSGITESERNAMLAPYTETKTVSGVETINTLAYRKRKIDVDSYKTAQSIDSKTSFVTTAVSKASVVTTEKTASDITAMQREAKLYDRTMPLRQLVKWGWEKILAPAYAANTTHTVITTGGGDYTTLNAYEDAIDGTAYSAGETATVNCSGTSADTTAVTFAGWDTDVSIIVNGDYAVTSGVHYSTSYYRIELTSSGAITLTQAKVTLNKIQVKLTLNGVQYNGIYITGASCKVQGCIIVCVGTSYGYGYGIYINADNTTTSIFNNVIYGWYYSGQTGRGIVTNPGLGSTAIFRIYNNTIIVSNIGIYVGNYSVNHISNNIVQDSDTDYYGTGDGASVKANNIAEDTTGTIQSTLTFVDKTNKDFHLAVGDTSAINAGTDLSAYFTTDIDGTTRSGTWDIGADEYVAAGGTSRRRMFIISKHEIHTHSDNSYCRLSDCIPSRRKDYKTV